MARQRGAFADAIRAARQRSGMTQTQVADASGVSRSTLIRWESGEITEPVFAHLRSFITAMDSPADDILRALGLLPRETDAPAGLDTDEQAIWSLGVRRGWPEDWTWSLVDLWRARRMRGERDPDPPVDPEGPADIDEELRLADEMLYGGDDTEHPAAS